MNTNPVAPRWQVRAAFFLAAFLITVAIVIACADRSEGLDHVTAWHAPTVDSEVRCDRQTGIQTATGRATNVENETATVRTSTGPIFTVGTTIPAHGTVTQHFTKPGNFVGTVTVRFAVDFPSDHTDRETSMAFRFPGGCTPPPPPPTTTTTTTAPPTTTTTAPPPPSTTTTTAPPVEIIPPAVECADDIETAAVAVCVTAAFTG